MSVERNPRPQPIDRFAVGHPCYFRFVGACHAVTRMRQPGSEVAVVRQEQKSFSVVVEPANRVDVITHPCEQIHDSASALRIRARRDETRRLVEKDVAQSRGSLDPASIDANIVLLGVDLHAHRQDGFAVHADAAVGDELLCGTPRRDASLREDLLKTN
jgi:hypothetical protein